MNTVAVQAPCGKCQTMVTVEIQAPPTMVNTEGVTAAIWEHPTTSTCMGCGTKVVGLVMAITGVKVIAAPVQNQNRIVEASVIPGR